MWEGVEDITGSRHGQVARSCEDGNAASDTMQCGERSEQHRNCQLLN